MLIKQHTPLSMRILQNIMTKLNLMFLVEGLYETEFLVKFFIVMKSFRNHRLYSHFTLTERPTLAEFPS